MNNTLVIPFDTQTVAKENKLEAAHRVKRKFTKLHVIIAHSKPAHHHSGYLKPKKHDHY